MKCSKCEHNKGDHTARGGDRLMERATGQVISPCYATILLGQITERCGCLHFEEVERKPQ